MGSEMCIRDRCPDLEVRGWTEALAQWCLRAHFPPLSWPLSPMDERVGRLAEFLCALYRSDNAGAVHLWETSELASFAPAAPHINLYVLARNRIRGLGLAHTSTWAGRDEEALRCFVRLLAASRDAEAVACWESSGLDTYLPAKEYAAAYRAVKSRKF